MESSRGRRGIRALVAVAGTTLWASAGFAADFDKGPVFTIIEENDLVVRTDRHYTQGIKLSYLHSDGKMPGWLEGIATGIPQLGFSNVVSRVGLQVGQNIYTPANIDTPDPLPKDRPYAGWLYTGFAVQRRGYTAERWLTLESFDVQLGIVGPESLAEQAQTWVHELRGFNVPQGWNHQIKTEPGIAMRYWRGVRFSGSGESTNYVDITPHIGASLGNIETALRGGARARLGVNLPDNFGPQTINSYLMNEGGWTRGHAAHSWSFYVFTGAEGSLVAHDIFLDGNLWQSSAHVTKEPAVLEWRSGFCLGFRQAELSFSLALRTKEFSRQTQNDAYGSLIVRVNL